MPKQRPRMFEFSRYGARSAHPLPAGTPPVRREPAAKVRRRTRAGKRSRAGNRASVRLEPVAADARIGDEPHPEFRGRLHRFGHDGRDPLLLGTEHIDH